MLSGPAVHELIADPDNRITHLLVSGQPEAAIVTELYCAALTRPPSSSELRAALADLGLAQSSAARRAALEDLLWALLNAKEFFLRR
jgi:hypothetical protein